MLLSGTFAQPAPGSMCLQEGMCMCVFVLLTVKGDGCGGKGGAITLGLQMGFPQEGHAPVFSETDRVGQTRCQIHLCILKVQQIL